MDEIKSLTSMNDEQEIMIAVRAPTGTEMNQYTQPKSDREKYQIHFSSPEGELQVYVASNDKLKPEFAAD
jgi:hypothetical protein